MKKLLILNTVEGCQQIGRISEICSALKGNVEIVDTAGATSLKEISKEVDFIIFWFCPPHGVDSPQGNAGDGSQRTPTQFPRLDPLQRNGLSVTAERLVVFADARSKTLIPNDLTQYRTYNVSTDEGVEALLCRLAHDPVAPIEKKPTAYLGVAQMMVGGIGVVIGNNDNTMAWLYDQVGERPAEYVHYCMVFVVFVLLASGLFSLLRMAVEPVWDSIKRVKGNIVDNHKHLWHIAIGVMSAIVVLVFGLRYFPGPPRLSRIVHQNVMNWATRLEGSQERNGGISEDADDHVVQAWATAQTLAGLLCSETNLTDSPWKGADYSSNIRDAFRFIDESRILNLELQEDQRDVFLGKLSQWMGSGDFTRLPTNFTTFTLALNVISRLGGSPDLTSNQMQRIENSESLYFKTRGPFDGWGYFEQFPHGITEITAWVTLAEVQSLEVTNPVIWETGAEREMIKSQIRDNIDVLRRRQIQDCGGFSPIFDSSDVTFARTYSTIMSLWAMSEASDTNLQIIPDDQKDAIKDSMDKAVRWLSKNLSLSPNNAASEGWRVNPLSPMTESTYLGLTAQTLCVLERTPIRIDSQSAAHFLQIKTYILRHLPEVVGRSALENDHMHDSDFYFYPTDYVLEPSTFLWYPWTVAMLRSFESDPSLNDIERKQAEELKRRFEVRADEFNRLAMTDFNYVSAEGLVGFNWPMNCLNQRPH